MVTVVVFDDFDLLEFGLSSPWILPETLGLRLLEVDAKELCSSSCSPTTASASM